jgi:hypothetical protein
VRPPGSRLPKGLTQVSGVNGERRETADVVILHAPLRSRADLERKADAGRRLESPDYPPDMSWALRRFHRLQLRGGLDREWSANSHDDSDGLDVYGVRHSVVRDTLLVRTLERASRSAGEAGPPRSKLYWFLQNLRMGIRRRRTITPPPSDSSRA